MLHGENTEQSNVEPWLRGTRQDVPAVLRAVLHAFDLAHEDFERWVWPLDRSLWEERPYGLPSVGFQARHIARSLLRLLTYAEGEQLTLDQLAQLHSEHDPQDSVSTRKEFEDALQAAEYRVLKLPMNALDTPRSVGRDKIPVTLAGLLVHLADHTQRHAGQAVTTAKVLLRLREAAQS